MKWLILLFTVFKPFFSSDHSAVTNPVTEIKEMIRSNAMKVVGFFAAASALATIFAAGIVLVAVDIGAQYDQNGYIYFSSMIIMGLALSLVSLVMGAIIAKSFHNADDSDKHKKSKQEVLTNVGTTHPLQDAIALLVLDFVKEREIKRNMHEQTSNASIREHEMKAANAAAENLRH